MPIFPKTTANLSIRRRSWKGTETEPTSGPQSACVVQLPAAVHGVVAATTGESKTIDEDWFAFDAQAGQTWLLTAVPEKSAVSETKTDSASDSPPPADDATADESSTMKSEASSNASQVLDPCIEVRDANGDPVLRTRLQAVRESYFTFRAKIRRSPTISVCIDGKIWNSTNISTAAVKS